MKSLLPADFYLREDVVTIARELLGKVLVTSFEGNLTAGKIVETEAYRAPDDLASHAYNNRRTPRTETMFKTGGHAYVYLCYGIHHLFNVVTGPRDVAHAVLVRAIEPVERVDIMMKRRKIVTIKPQLTAGPGVLTQALGIRMKHDGLHLTSKEGPIWIEDRGFRLKTDQIAVGTRVGVGYAGASARLPWRFWEKNSSWRSKAN